MQSGNGLITPSPLKLNGNLLENWREFKQRFTIFLSAAEVYGKPAEKVKVALFLNLIGEEAFKLHKLIKYPTSRPENGVTLKVVMDGYDDYLTTCHNSELYNSFKFEERKQLDGENFEDFLMAIAVMAENCKFPDVMLERKMRDKIVSGINDSDLRMKLMMMEDHSLQSIIDCCKEAEKQKNNDKLSSLKLTESREFFFHKNILKGSAHNRSDILKKMRDLPAQGATSKQNKNDSTAPKKSLDNEIHKILNEAPLSNVAWANVPSTSRIDEAPVGNENIIHDDDSEVPNQKKRKIKDPKTKSNKMYECPHCSKKYVRLIHFKNHEKLHTGEGLVSCNICKKSYSCETYLKSHMMLHSNEKPFSCEKCGKKFNFKNHLIMHACYPIGK